MGFSPATRSRGKMERERDEKTPINRHPSWDCDGIDERSSLDGRGEGRRSGHDKIVLDVEKKCERKLVKDSPGPHTPPR